ncbi:MAG: hypothetical protein C0478_03775 [Planctomyces sp.]|nr:hypothetical protein [Planctomyces sp.]
MNARSRQQSEGSQLANAVMQLDLRRTVSFLQKHIEERIRDYDLCINEGPGGDETPIKQITIGYQFDQAGWLSIVFDTRSTAANDGEWNTFIESNAIEVTDWHNAYSDLVENGSPINLTLPDGSERRLGENTTVKYLAELIGTTIRDVLIHARDEGSFNDLPISEDCFYVVEEHDGAYGWSDHLEVESQSEQAYLDQLEGDVSSKTQDAQIEHWIGLLERIASGKENTSEWAFLAPRYAIERLKELGDDAIVPVLKFVRKWAGKPEFDGDRPKRKIVELPMHAPAIDALMLVCNSSCQVVEVESLLCDIVRRSVKVNSGRKLWGIIPVWAARCLSTLFNQYPKPIQHGSTNKLVNHEEYARIRRTKRRDDTVN